MALHLENAVGRPVASIFFQKILIAGIIILLFSDNRLVLKVCGAKSGSKSSSGKSGSKSNSPKAHASDEKSGTSPGKSGSRSHRRATEMRFGEQASSFPEEEATGGQFLSGLDMPRSDFSSPNLKQLTSSLKAGNPSSFPVSTLTLPTHLAASPEGVHTQRDADRELRAWTYRKNRVAGGSSDIGVVGQSAPMPDWLVPTDPTEDVAAIPQATGMPAWVMPVNLNSLATDRQPIGVPDWVIPAEINFNPTTGQQGAAPVSNVNPGVASLSGDMEWDQWTAYLSSENTGHAPVIAALQRTLDLDLPAKLQQQVPQQGQVQEPVEPVEAISKEAISMPDATTPADGASSWPQSVTQEVATVPQNYDAAGADTEDMQYQGQNSDSTEDGHEANAAVPAMDSARQNPLEPQLQQEQQQEGGEEEEGEYEEGGEEREQEGKQEEDASTPPSKPQGPWWHDPGLGKGYEIPHLQRGTPAAAANDWSRSFDIPADGLGMALGDAPTRAYAAIGPAPRPVDTPAGLDVEYAAQEQEESASPAQAVDQVQALPLLADATYQLPFAEMAQSVAVPVMEVALPAPEQAAAVDIAPAVVDIAPAVVDIAPAVVDIAPVGEALPLLAPVTDNNAVQSFLDSSMPQPLAGPVDTVMVQPVTQDQASGSQPSLAAGTTDMPAADSPSALGMPVDGSLGASVDGSLAAQSGPSSSITDGCTILFPPVQEQVTTHAVPVNGSDGIPAMCRITGQCRTQYELRPSTWEAGYDLGDHLQRQGGLMQPYKGEGGRRLRRLLQAGGGTRQRVVRFHRPKHAQDAMDVVEKLITGGQTCSQSGKACGEMGRRVGLHLGEHSLGSCAVVGLGKNLMMSRYGPEIDMHDTVIRFGFTPVRGFEWQVGVRRSVIFIRNVNRDKGRSAINAGDVWGGRPQVPDLFFLHHDHAVRTAFGYLLTKPYVGMQAVTETVAANTLYDLLQAFVTVTNASTGEPATPLKWEPTEGFRLVIMLMHSQLCSRIDLYGFSQDGVGHYFVRPSDPEKFQNLPLAENSVAELEYYVYRQAMANRMLCIHDPVPYTG